MPEAFLLAARLVALTSCGLVYLWLIGLAVEPWLLPRAWRPYRWAAAPLIGWSALVAVAYPLNATFPGRSVLLGLGALALAGCVGRVVRRRESAFAESWSWLVSGIGIVSLTPAITLYAGARALSTLVADSDVEHFADVIAALLAFPIGWSVEGQMGLEATPVGLAYHYVHAAISAVTGHDTFGTAVPSHLTMVAVAPASVYVFARETLGAGPRLAAGVAALGALGSFSLGVPAFGWGQQTAALVTLPAGLAGVRRALAGGRIRDVVTGGLLASLAAGSLYLASAPLVGGVAALAGLVLVRSLGIVRITRRLLGVGLVMLLAGALSHLSTAGFFLAGGLTGGDLQGRATHVAVFASALQAIGVQPLTLFTVGSASPLAVSFLAALGGAVTAASGIVRWRGEPVVLGTLLTFLGFELYLRVMRPFPYGEFKLLTTVWPLLPALVVVGASALRARWPALAPLWVACVVLFGAGLTLTHWHVRSGLAEPWGAALPEREMDALRHVTSRVPSGAAVWVSNQLVPEAAMRWAGVETQARHGYASREAGASALAQRWRGAATALPSPIAHPTYGLVERHSTELRNPIEPASADFLLLDESEDPLFFGLTETALQGAAGRLRLYRGAGGASLPPAPLPIGESLPGRRQGFGLLRRAPAAPAVSGLSYSAHALWAGAETEVRLAGSAGERRVALFPGITWFISVDSTLQLAPTDATETQALTRRTLRPGAWTRGEQLERSRAGILAPGVLVSEGEADLTVHYVNLSASLVSTAARPQRSATIWLAGQPAGMQVLLDPPLTSARVPASTRWLEIGPEGRAALHAPAGVGLFSLPLVGGPAESPTLTNGDLVKGSSARLHLVQDGRLHWVPTLEALRRLGSIPRVITLRDEDLWRLAVGLPLE